MVNFYSKQVLNSFFLCLSNIQLVGFRAKGESAKKEACSVYRILDFHFFPNFVFALCSIWCHLQCNCSHLDGQSLIIFKWFYKLYGVGVLSQDAHQLNNSTSFIFTYLKVEFEPCVVNLIWKEYGKTQKRKSS